MSEKSLTILGAIAGVLLVLTVIVGMSDPTVKLSFKAGQPLVESLDLDSVQKVVVKKGEDTVTLVQEGGTFRVDEKFSYSADQKVVGRLMRQIDELICESQVTDDTDDYDELEGQHAERSFGGTPPSTSGVDISGPNKFCTEVGFFDREGRMVTRVFVTDNATLEEGAAVRYGRVEGDPMVYRLQASSFFPMTEPVNYLDRMILELGPERIANIQVQPSGRDSYSLDVVTPEPDTSDPTAPTQAQTPDVTLLAVPDGLRQVDSEVRKIAMALRQVRLDDLLPASELEAMVGDVKFGSRFRVLLNEGGSRLIEFGQSDDGKWWGKFSASAADVWPVRDPETLPRTDAEVAALRQTRLAARAAFDAANAFNSEHGGWIYQLPNFAIDNLILPIEDLCEDASLPAEIEASRIVIAWSGARAAGPEVTRTKEEALPFCEELLEQLKADPSKFAELATEHSDDKRSNSKGGSIGAPFGFRKFSEEFADVAFRLEVGAMHPEVVETPIGYQIIRRDS
ncbi:MAG: peptidylprolyl isomerase [Planctomycetota bacterium]